MCRGRRGWKGGRGEGGGTPPAQARVKLVRRQLLITAQRPDKAPQDERGVRKK
jgi:hypothetical protein